MTAAFLLANGPVKPSNGETVMAGAIGSQQPFRLFFLLAAADAIVGVAVSHFRSGLGLIPGRSSGAGAIGPMRRRQRLAPRSPSCRVAT